MEVSGLGAGGRTGDALSATTTILVCQLSALPARPRALDAPSTLVPSLSFSRFSPLRRFVSGRMCWLILLVESIAECAASRRRSPLVFPSLVHFCDRDVAHQIDSGDSTRLYVFTGS